MDEDLDIFLMQLKMGRMQEEEVRTFQFPMLTENELSLWKNQDSEFLSSFQLRPIRSFTLERDHPMEFITVSCSRFTMFKETEKTSFSPWRCNLF